MTFFFKKYFLLFFLCLGISGCLKDDVSPVAEISLSDNALLLHALEQDGDYGNSAALPSVVDVDEVANNLGAYLLLDLRTVQEYADGHISGAVHLRSDSLLAFLNSVNSGSYAKIVLISSDGQASSYFTSLLRLYGIPNAYSLLFGMSQWNAFFSHSWTDNIADNIQVTRNFTFSNYSSEQLFPLPDIALPNSGAEMKTKIKMRIADLIHAGFADGGAFVKIYPPDTMMFNGEAAADFYIVCYGDRSLHAQNSFDPVSVGHFPRSVSFLPGKDFKSTENLQLLPNNRKIVVYSYSGQESAFITAYLRVLGYDAKSLSFGAHTLFYSFLFAKKSAYSPFVFLTSNIRNYNYVTGMSAP